MKPREKLAQYWPHKLESWELVATIIGTGTKDMSVFRIAKRVAKLIARKQDAITIEDLLTVHGVGHVKATQIISAFELARRHYAQDDVRIESSNDVMRELWEYGKKKQEYLLSLTLDGANRLIKKRVITIGLLDQSLAHPREIFSWAIEDRAHSLILAHNHPSGSTNPSSEDISTTLRVSEVGRLVGIKLLDHVIIGAGWYYSFKENALIS